MPANRRAGVSGVVLGGLVRTLSLWVPALPLWAQQGRPAVELVSTHASAELAFRHVTIVDTRDGRRLPDQVVIVAGSRIQRLGPAGTVPVPKGARVVDARGKYLIPGLWDMHVHPLGYADVAYPLFIANGVTGVRDAGSSVPLATLAQWKREIASGTRVGPRLIVSGPAINGFEGPRSKFGDTDNVYQGTGLDRHWIYVPLAAAARVVDSLKAAGADMLKFYGMSPQLRFALAAEARRVGIPFGGHSSDTPGEVFSDSGATILDHVTYFKPDACDDAGKDFDESACTALVQRLWRNNTWVMLWGIHTPVSWATIARALRYKPDSLKSYAGLLDAIQDPRIRGDRRILDSLAAVQSPHSTADWLALFQSGNGLEDLPLKQYAPAQDVQVRAARRRESGRRLPVLAGTDIAFLDMGFYVAYLPGFALPEVLELFVVDRGMTPLEALQTATLNPALALRATDSLGTVERGKLADLVLLDADPLADIWNVTKIRAVVANGRYYDRAALDGLLDAAAHAAGH